MTFLAPAALWWLLGLAAVLALYLIRRRATLQPVTTLPFYMMLHKHLAESPWLRILKKILSFVLIAALLILCVMALARPVVDLRQDGIDHVVICLDRSASTAAADDRGQVFARLQSAARGLVAAQPDSVAITVVACAAEPEVLIAQSYNHMQVDHLIASLSVTALPDNHAATRQLLSHLTTKAEDNAASKQTDSFKNHAVWWFGDTLQPWADEHTVLTVNRGSNVGITACSLRPRPMETGSYDAFIELSGLAQQQVSLEVYQGADLLSVQAVELPAAGLDQLSRRQLTVPISAEAAGTIMRLRVQSEDDMLSLDDEVLLPVPDAQRPTIAWVHQEVNGFTALALATMDMDIIPLQVGDAVPEHVDVVVYEQSPLPDTIQHPTIILNPSDALPAIQAQSMPPRVVQQPRVLDASHPILFGVSVPRLSLAQTARLDVNSSLAPVVGGPSGPFIAAGYLQQQRIVLLGLDPSLSPELGLTASYPSLIASSLMWALAEQHRRAEVLSTGSYVQRRLTAVTSASSDQTVHWDLPTGETISQPMAFQQLIADRVGVVTVDQQRQGVALLSPSESAIPYGRDETKLPSGHAAWNWWLVLAACLLLGESWACHRKGIF